MRLNRFISASGFASRRSGEVYIREGRVRVNGEVVTDPARAVVPDHDDVTVDGSQLEIKQEKRHYVLNKPTGVIVSMADTHGRATVQYLLGKETKGVFPVGRLDADTSGVLLFTDDGDLTHRLTHPSFGVEKVYRAGVHGRVTEEDTRRMEKGLMLDDGPAASAVMRILKSSNDTSLVEIIIHQGRKHQVRRMLAAIGHPVITLDRRSFGGITGKGLPVGSYRQLTSKEVERLKKLSAKSQKQRSKPIVAIDGPVGAGKSTTARKVAEKLGFMFVDSGAMYRAVTLDVLNHGVNPEDEIGVGRIAASSRVKLVNPEKGQRTFLNGKDVTDRIRDRDVTAAVSAVSAQRSVRERMTRLQREIGRKSGVVMEGRDIGTVVFPDADYKIFLDAAIETRAQRRYEELVARGVKVSLEELIEEIKERDRANMERELAPLKKAPDAVLIDTTNMTFDEQVAAIVSLVRGEKG